MRYLWILLISTSLFAGNGNEVGNGGDAIICKGKAPVLLDYFEMKQMSFNRVSGDWKSQVEKRLKGIKRFNSRLSEQLLFVLIKLEKRLVFIPNSNFRDVDDSYEVSLPKTCKKEQLAIRQESKIHINKDLWDQMSLDDKSGLILHEIVYEHFIGLGDKNSLNTRKFVRLLSSKEYEKFDSKKWKKFVKKFKLALY